VAQLNFYATTDDLLGIIDFMFSVGDLELYEAYSAKDADIRQFTSADEVVKSNHIQGNHGGIFVRGAWRTVTGALRIRRFPLNPDVGQFRHEVTGVGTFQLIQGRPMHLAEGSLDRSMFSHWNEAGARRRATFAKSELDEVNWAEFARLSRKVHREVRVSLAVARIPSGHIMQGAFELLRAGGQLFGYPSRVSIASPELAPCN